MFETVLPETFQSRSRRIFYETLPLSLAIHALAVGGAVGATLWNVVFPTASPRVSVAYSLITVPDPPPPPPPAPKADVAKPEVKQLPPPAPLPLAQITAPTVIPDRIPDVIEPPPLPPQPVGPVTTTALPDGILGGDVLGKIHGKPGGIAFPDDGRVHIERDSKLPMESLSQDYPKYPSDAQKKRLEGQVVVRYVIGTNGRVKDVEIIDHAIDPSFDDAAVEAIKHWRFRPLIKNGKPVEVVHELAVNFEIVVR